MQLTGEAKVRRNCFMHKSRNPHIYFSDGFWHIVIAAYDAARPPCHLLYFFFDDVKRFFRK